MLRFRAHLKVGQSSAYLANNTQAKTDMHVSCKAVESVQRVKEEELWRKVFVEKMSFEPGVEDRRVIDGDSGDEGNDELVCVRSDESDMSS